MTGWTDLLQSWTTVLQLPTMLVTGAEGAASKVTGLAPVKVPQTVVNAATGQTAPPEVVQSWLPQLPDVTLPDFSLSSLFPDQTANLTKYALYGGAGILALLVLTRPPSSSRRRRSR